MTSSAKQPATATAPGPASDLPSEIGDEIGSLREEAAKAGLLIGSGAIKGMTTTADDRPENYLAETRFREVLSEQFDSLSPENDLKWEYVQPEEGIFDFEGLDRLVTYAETHGMVVKGHGLISSSFNPAYLAAKISDPAAFRAAMVDHFTTIMTRYKGKMDRWDVVTEALETMGGGLQHNDFYKALGPDYIAEAFRIAHQADPAATLFLNENLVETYPEKRQELYDLVSSLVADEVPIHGIALQMHETFEGPPAGTIKEMTGFFHNLGLKVSIAEMDVHTHDVDAQAQIYGDVMTEALNAGIEEISFWGFTDKHLYTWLPGAKPLIFDENYRPKPAYFAVRDALRNFVAMDRRSAPATPTVDPAAL